MKQGLWRTAVVASAMVIAAMGAYGQPNPGTITGPQGTVLAQLTVQENAVLSEVPAGADISAILHSTIGDNRSYVMVFNEVDRPTVQYLRTRGITGQDYTTWGVYIKIRDAFGVPVVLSRESIRNVSYVVNPKDGDGNPTTGRWRGVDLTPTDWLMLRNDYCLQLRPAYTSSLKTGDFLVVHIVLADGSAKYIAVRQETPPKGWTWLGRGMDLVDFPLLTYTNVAAIGRGEATVLFGLIPFTTISFNVLRYFVPARNRVWYLVEPFLSADLIGMASLRGQVVGGAGEGSWGGLPQVFSSFHFGSLVGVSVGTGIVYVGYAVQPRFGADFATFTLDHGFVIAASVFDLIGIVTKKAAP